LHSDIKEERIAIEKLFNLLHTGDFDAFGDVISPLRGRIVRLAQQRLRRDEVEDVVQETLSTFWEKRLSVRDPDHLLPFLHQILRNKLGDSYRRKKRWKKIWISKSELQNSVPNPDSAAPEILLEEKEFRRILKQAINTCSIENSTLFYVYIIF